MAASRPQIGTMAASSSDCWRKLASPDTAPARLMSRRAQAGSHRSRSSRTVESVDPRLPPVICNKRLTPTPVVSSRNWPTALRTRQNGRVGVWRGGFRLSMRVAAPFVRRCLSGSSVAPFPHAE
jgi:hypothetical protein